MLQLAICDRSSEYRRQLSELLEERLQTIASEVELFSSGEELLRYLNAGYAPDIAVLGIASQPRSTAPITSGFFCARSWTAGSDRRCARRSRLSTASAAGGS